MLALVNAARLSRQMALGSYRMMSTGIETSSKPNPLEKVEHDIFRPPTMDDLMEPYGSYKTAYEAEKRRGNRTLALGVLSLGTALTIFYHSGVIDGLFMPNLDNIMEETEPWDWGDKTGRITV